MKNCYLCGCAITTENKTKEHIIPNALGGKLTSFDIICKSCNSKTGEGMDSNFINSIQKTNLMSLLNINRDRGVNPSIEGQDEEYLYVLEWNQKLQRLEGKRRENKPLDNSENGIIRFEDITPKQAKSILEKLKLTYPEINVEEQLSKINWSTPYWRDDVKINITLERPNDIRALVKIAINYFLFKGGSVSDIQDGINFLIGKDIERYIAFLIQDEKVYTEGEVSHTIFLSGNPNDRFLYCYINLFSVYSYVVLLNVNYGGKLIQEQYVYDLKGQNEIQGRNLDYIFTQDQLCEHINSYSIESVFDNMEKKITQIIDCNVPGFKWD